MRVPTRPSSRAYPRKVGIGRDAKEGLWTYVEGLLRRKRIAALKPIYGADKILRFLAGITRNRTAKLLRNAGVTVDERTVTTVDLDEADEMFTTGNAGKVQPVSRYESRDLQPGPIARQAHELYMAFARTQRVI